jgi:hypothetical protein
MKRKRMIVDTDTTPTAGLRHWRTELQCDIPMIGTKYGYDLESVPENWLDASCARQALQCCGLLTPSIGGGTETLKLSGTLDFWEIYAGCGNLTAACLEPVVGGALSVGPPVEIKQVSQWPQLSFRWDLLLPSCRKILWAVLVVCKPKWVHCGPPCTFWSQLARCNNRRTETTNESLRAEAAVHIILTSQICRYQAAHGRHASLEHPPTAASWKLDVMRDLLLDIGMTRFVTDSCPWGHRDPGNGLPYKKRGCFASWVSLAALERKCTCVGEHQTVHRTVQGGTRHGEQRSKVSGAYPHALCIAFAKVIRELIHP